MKRSELARILRAACDVTSDPEIIVIGSQAILATFDEEELPSRGHPIVEADGAVAPHSLQVQMQSRRVW